MVHIGRAPESGCCFGRVGVAEAYGEYVHHHWIPRARRKLNDEDGVHVNLTRKRS
jgi:hypothetical protein